MAEFEQPQIYLITPPEIDLLTFPDMLAGILDATPIACIRLSLSSRDEVVIARAGDALREVTHPRDVALVIEDHVQMVERLGLDGVHLSDSPRSVRQVRKDLGRDAIVGASCGTSQDAGMSAGESGADYVSFGPVSASPLGDGDVAGADLFSWWSEMVEVPVVAEGYLDEETIRTLCPVTDFFAIGQEIWNTDNPQARLAELVGCIG
ncbi:MAG: thiamine phosphate synthase [Marinosulfonomonas sp.]|nr:thiamine phosphate synthase [Marinosulfonomonas sp.]